MTQTNDLTQSRTGAKLTLAEVFESLLKRPVPIRFTAYDGSAYGPEDAPIGLELKNERGLAYLVTAPGDLGHGAGLRLRRPRHPRHPPR